MEGLKLLMSLRFRFKREVDIESERIGKVCDSFGGKFKDTFIRKFSFNILS